MYNIDIKFYEIKITFQKFLEVNLCTIDIPNMGLKSVHVTDIPKPVNCNNCHKETVNYIRIYSK